MMRFLRDAFCILCGMLIVALHFFGMFPVVLILLCIQHDNLTAPMFLLYVVVQIVFYDVFFKLLNKIS